MATDLTTRAGGTADENPAERWVTFQLNGRTWGVPLGQVRDAVTLGTMTPVPLAPPKVRGMIRLGAGMATVIDLRRALGLPPAPAGTGEVGLTVEVAGHLYTLIVDAINAVGSPQAGARMERVDLAAVVAP